MNFTSRLTQKIEEQQTAETELVPTLEGSSCSFIRLMIDNIPDAALLYNVSPSASDRILAIMDALARECFSNQSTNVPTGYVPSASSDLSELSWVAYTK